MNFDAWIKTQNNIIAKPSSNRKIFISVPIDKIEYFLGQPILIIQFNLQ